MSSSNAKDLFLEALDLPEAEWPAFLDERCGEDDALRRRVAGLLAAHGDADTRLSVGGLASPAGVAATLRRRGGGLAVGDRIDDYQLDAQIGEGGFGTVYRATQLEPVWRPVALKVVKLGMDTEAIIARFEAERQALALMDHPHIARVYDAGSTPAGRPYFVMELVDGVPITAFCAVAGYTIDQRLDLFVLVCKAIQHAHQKGVIHRDIKPGNVLVSEVDGVPVPKVIDFGVAKATQDGGDGGAFVTREGQLLGTPAYMSPEQVEGAVDIDTRSDVYSLGVLLYELLTGVMPFDLDACGVAELQNLICTTDPPLPSQRTAGADKSEQIPGDLDWIVMRCLEKERARRYDSAAALARDVDRFLDEMPVEAAPPSTWYRVSKLALRHRGMTVATLGICLSLVVGAIGLGFGLQEARQANADLDAALAAARFEAEHAREAEAEAAAQAAEAREQAEVAAAVSDFLNQDVLDAASPSGRPGRGRNVLVRDVLVAASRRIDDAGAPGGRFVDKPLVERAIRDTMGGAFAALGLYEESVTHYERAAALGVATLGPRDGAVLDSQRVLADSLRRLGRVDEAAQLGQRTLDELEARNPSGVRTIAAMRMMGLVRVEQGANDEGLALLELAVRRSEDAYGPLADPTLEALSTLGIALGQLSRLKDAEEVLRKTVENRGRRLGPDDPQCLADSINLANVLRGQGRHEEAGALYSRALPTLIEKQGQLHPDVLAAQHSQARLLMDMGAYDESEALLRSVLERCVRVLGRDHTETSDVAGGLGRVLQLGGRLEEAERAYREAWETTRAAFGDENPYTVSRLQEVTSVLHQMGRLAEAEPLMEEVVARQTAIYGPDSPRTISSLGNLAIVFLELGRVEEAEEMFRAVADSQRRAAGAESLLTLEAESNLAALLCQIGKVEEAEVLARGTLERGRSVASADSLELAVYLIRYGTTLLPLERYAESEVILHEALVILEAHYEPHFRTAEAYEKLAYACQELGRDEDAERYDARLGRWMETWGGP